MKRAQITIDLYTATVSDLMPFVEGAQRREAENGFKQTQAGRWALVLWQTLTEAYGSGITSLDCFGGAMQVNIVDSNPALVRVVNFTQRKG